MIFIYWYLSVGCSLYVIFMIQDATTGLERLQESDMKSIILGTGVMIFAWPALPWMVYGKD